MLTMVISKAIPGKKLIQYLPLSMYSKPVKINRPKDGFVIGTPIPRNESVASSKMACATWTVPTTISGGRTLGIK